MTDNDIIKALECCSKDTYICKECQLYVERKCMRKLNSLALDLINRQQAEIERLKGWQDLLKAEKHSLIKAEAVKEFAEKVKKELSLLKKECRKVLDNDGAFAIDRARKKIDNLVKEIVGDKR